jgi:hypothetical protein
VIDLVAKEDDLFVFVIGIHFRKPFQATFAGSSGESGCQDGCLDNQRDCGVGNLDIVCHNRYLELKLNKEMVGRFGN